MQVCEKKRHNTIGSTSYQSSRKAWPRICNSFKHFIFVFSTQVSYFTLSLKLSFFNLNDFSFFSETLIPLPRRISEPILSRTRGGGEQNENNGLGTISPRTFQRSPPRTFQRSNFPNISPGTFHRRIAGRLHYSHHCCRENCLWNSSLGCVLP